MVGVKGGGGRGVGVVDLEGGELFFEVASPFRFGG
jgi:hypothetical protein